MSWVFWLTHPAPEAESGSLAGQLLVATSDLHDPNFDHAVIYMVRHDANGAMGLVVNDPIRDVPLATVFEQAGLNPAGVAGTIHLHAGRPVQRTRFLVLHTDDYAIPDTLRISGGLAVTSHVDKVRQAVAEATVIARGVRVGVRASVAAYREEGRRRKR